MNLAPAVQERLAKIADYRPGYGAHSIVVPPDIAPAHSIVVPPDIAPEPGQACVMELVAWVAGEPWSDHPGCTCTVIAWMLRTCNDRMGQSPAADERRASVLSPLIPVVIGTASTAEVRERRIWLAADWSLRGSTPKFLRVAGMEDAARELEALAPIENRAALSNARHVAQRIANDAWASRNARWSEIRKKHVVAAAAADAAAAAVAVAAAAAAADAVAVADAAADADAVAVADAVGGGDGVGVVAVADVDPYRQVIEAAKKAQDAGGGWSEQYAAARKVADEVIAPLVAPKYAHLRNEVDQGFMDLVRRMAAITA